MPPPLLPLILPLEIRYHIFQLLNDKTLALEYPEVFRAIAPDFLRELRVGRSYPFDIERFQNQFVEIYPSCGVYAHLLTLVADPSSVNLITNFLQSFPFPNNLKHLRIEESKLPGTFWSAESLPYLNLLEELLASSPTLTRLSFYNFRPCSSLISSPPSLTRLDFGLRVPLNPDFHIHLPSQLEIISLTPVLVGYLSRPPPPALRVLVVYADEKNSSTLISEVQSYIAQSPSLTKIALVDRSKCFI